MTSPLASLRNRVFLAGALVAVLSVFFAIQVVSRRVVAEADAELVRALERSVAMIQRRHALRVESLTTEARLVADLPTLKAAVATGDPPTVAPVADDLAARVQAELIAVTDAGRGLLATGVEPGPEQEEAITEAIAGREAATFRPSAHGVIQVVTVPIVVGPAPREVLGTLSLGFAIDERLAAEFKTLTGADVAFVASGVVRASTLPAPDASVLVALAGRETAETVPVGGEPYVAMSRPLTAVPGAPAVVVLRSRTERQRLLASFRTALLGASLVGVLVAVAASYVVARTVTRPMAELTRVMQEMTETGDLARRIPVPEAWDENAAVLARTFDALTEAVGRFQREAALRERLSALGRLSTVIAHEIRNPLMIIKSSLLSLRREGATVGDARAVADDIEEEVARLNRIVGDVLDFARPVRLEKRPVDLVRLCNDAVVAALEGYDVSARVDVGPGFAGTVLTDGERLRTVLVNGIANARDAVLARRQAAGGEREPDEIVVLARRPRPGMAELVVRDRGAGVPAADLPNVFEPFFTTKRTGTGLGLAIARNVVEAMGGAIGLRNLEDGGTELKIEVPDVAAVEDSLGRHGS